MTAAVAVRERPIPFSSEMVRAILDGQKSQTRRVVKPQPPDWITEFGFTAFTPPGTISGRGYWKGVPGDEGPGEKFFRSPYGVFGDRLWVREAYRLFAELDALPASKIPRGRLGRISYEANAEARPVDGRLRVARFMPRAFSRITLEITNVRVERLQDISEEDAKAEGLVAQEGDGGRIGAGYKWRGVGYHGAGYDEHRGMTFHVPENDGRCHCKLGGPSAAQCAYRELWDSLNAKRGFGWDVNPWVWVIEFKRVRP